MTRPGWNWRARDRTVRVWQVATAQCVLVFRDHENWVRAACFHPAGHCVISVAEDRTVRALDLKEGRCKRTVSGAHEHFLTSLAVRANGTLLLTGAPPAISREPTPGLAAGDEVAVEIEGIGRLVNTVAGAGAS